MIVVKIELWSARTHVATEIGRMYIANDGTHPDHKRGNYQAAICRRGSKDVPQPLDPNGPVPTRQGSIKDFPRLSYSIWRMVLRALREAFPEEK